MGFYMFKTIRPSINFKVSFIKLSNSYHVLKTLCLSWSREAKNGSKKDRAGIG